MRLRARTGTLLWHGMVVDTLRVTLKLKSELHLMATAMGSDWRLEELQRIATPELQLFASKPPGKGFAVVYAGRCGNGLVYVGKHIHGNHGRSVRSTRWCTHSSAKSYFGNCIRKHGVQWYVIARTKEEDVLAKEAHLISESGLNTLYPNGLNFREDGLKGGSKWSEDLVKRVKVARAEPEYRESRRQSSLSWVAAETVDRKASRISKQKSAKATSEWKAEASKRVREQLESETEEHKASRMAKVKATCNTDEYRAKRSETHWVYNEDDAHNAARQKKKHETFMKKREARYAAASPEERIRMEKQNAKNDRRLAATRRFAL